MQPLLCAQGKAAGSLGSAGLQELLLMLLGLRLDPTGQLLAVEIQVALSTLFTDTGQFKMCFCTGNFDSRLCIHNALIGKAWLFVLCLPQDMCCCKASVSHLYHRILVGYVCCTLSEAHLIICCACMVQVSVFSMAT